MQKECETSYYFSLILSWLKCQRLFIHKSIIIKDFIKVSYES